MLFQDFEAKMKQKGAFFKAYSQSLVNTKTLVWCKTHYLGVILGIIQVLPLSAVAAAAADMVVVMRSFNFGLLAASFRRRP